MAIFNKKKPTTAEELLKAVDSLPEEEKDKFVKAIKDHIDESVAAQEADEGQTDEQSAEDRIDESVGEEVADDKKDDDKDDGEEAKDGDEEDKSESDESEADIEVTEESGEAPAENVEEEAKTPDYDALVARIEALEEFVHAMKQKPVEADKDTANQLDRLAAKFN